MDGMKDGWKEGRNQSCFFAEMVSARAKLNWAYTTERIMAH